MKQPSADRALYLRQVRDTIRGAFAPELTSSQAIDAVALVDRILVELIVEEEEGAELSAHFGGEFAAVLDPDACAEHPPLTVAQFHELRARVAEEVGRSAGSADRAARDRARRLVETERAFLERVDELRTEFLAAGTSDGDAPAPAECSFTREQLAGVLRSRLDASPGLEVTHLSVVPGGRSKETVLASLTGTTELPPEVIVRKDRPVSVLPTRAADEYAVIKAVHDFGGVPVPEPYFAVGDGNALGTGTFLVMERVPGRKAGEFFPDIGAPTEHREDIGLHLAASLARLHALPLERLAAAGVDAGAAPVTEASVVGSVDAIIERIAGLSGPPCATVPLARQWLHDHVVDVVPAPRLALLQGDFGFHNMLVDGARVSALVDWEAATIGPPARELAAAWNAVAVLMPWPAFVDAYVAAGGAVDDTDPRAVAYYRVLGALGGFMASRIGGDLFRSGAKRDLLTAHSGLDAHFRCARNLARALADAMD